MLCRGSLGCDCPQVGTVTRVSAVTEAWKFRVVLKRAHNHQATP
jgi:hypothetical protein